MTHSGRCSGWAYRTALRSFIRSELYHRLSGNSRAVLQPNFRLYDRAALDIIEAERVLSWVSFAETLFRLARLRVS